MDARSLFDEFVQDESGHLEAHWLVRRCKELWAMAAQRFGFTDDERLRKLQTSKLVIGSRLDYKEGRGAWCWHSFRCVQGLYFGYRYLVDKYNFLFVYRVRGFPAGNDGKLMDRVLCIMQFCVIFFLAAMLLFFAVQGDSMKLQAICTLGLLVFYKLLPSGSDRFQASLLEGMQTVNSFVDGPTDYEVFSQPDLDWNLKSSSPAILVNRDTDN
ncbi:hypothetical protein ZWY2020_037706 [Hordeum vulgare]|nr:hypothetical protein ZWY2020_037706 [Hordeum vulgare]